MKQANPIAHFLDTTLSYIKLLRFENYIEKLTIFKPKKRQFPHLMQIFKERGRKTKFDN